MSAGEFDFIDWIRTRQSQPARLLTGIGDDGAVIAGNSRCTVVVADMLMEGAHFEFPSASPEQAGRKSLAVNLSDIAAMGAVPEFAFVSIAVPQYRGHDFGQRVMKGLQTLAEEFDVVIAGGDTNSWDGPLVLNVTVTGTASAPVHRNGAQAGDWIFVTGELGGTIFEHHLTFKPRLVEAAWLMANIRLTSMIDVSDGLSSDIFHVARASGVGFQLFAAQIPVSRRVEQHGVSLGSRAALQHALNDGEDFELLFTCHASDGRKLIELQAQGALPECRLSHIGIVTTDRSDCDLRFPDQTQQALVAGGFQHKLG